MGKIIQGGNTLAVFNYTHSDTLITKTITQSGTYNASSDNADGYSSVTVNINSVPSGTHLDPWNTNTAYTTNIGLATSFYDIVSGELIECVLIQVAPTSGYEGICIQMPSDANLVDGTNYTLSFTLDISNATFESSSYPFGVAHSATQITNFNYTPDVDFAKQSGIQSVSLPFTAGSTNYLAIMLSQLKSTRAILKLSSLQFVEVT